MVAECRPPLPGIPLEFPAQCALVVHWAGGAAYSSWMYQRNFAMQGAADGRDMSSCCAAVQDGVCDFHRGRVGASRRAHAEEVAPLDGGADEACGDDALEAVRRRGAVAAEAMCATSSCAVRTGSCRNIVGICRLGAHVAGQHSSGPECKRGLHVCLSKSGPGARSAAGQTVSGMCDSG
jgi:hypothetical protein